MITWNEYLTLQGWGNNLFIWAGSGEYNKAVDEYNFYKSTLYRFSFSKEEIHKNPDILLTVNIECHKEDYEKLAKDTKLCQEKRNEYYEINGYNYR
jgi:hypothetical protein